MADKVAVGSSVRFLSAPTVYERPSDLLDDVAVTVQRSRRAVVAVLTRELERAALDSGEPLAVLASFVDFDRFTDQGSARFAQLADSHPFVALVGPSAPTLPRLHSAAIDPNGRRWSDWALVIVGAHHASALIARETDGDDTVFDFALTQRRDIVLAAGRSLIARILPSTGGTVLPTGVLAAQ